MSYINRNSELARRFWENESLPDCPIYDFHGHMHEMSGGYLPAADPADMADTLRRAGAESFIFCSHLALYAQECGEAANEGPVSRYGKPFRAYLAVKSYKTDPENDLKRFAQHPGMYAGCKFLPDYWAVPLTDVRNAPYWEYLEEHRLLALVHTWGGSRYNGAEEVRAAAEKYPHVTIICGHSIHGQWDKAMDLVRDFPNVYLELTAVLDDRGILDRFVREIGSERILFGTDLPWFSTYHGIGAVLDAEMTDDDRHNILHRNGERILKAAGLM